MPHDITLISTIAASFGLALIFGFIATRLKLPALVGYLTGGIVLGPGTPGFVADITLSGQLAEIGVMLLMFGVGLHFSLKDLMAVKRIAIPGAIAQISLATLMGMGLTHFWGWSIEAGVVFGLALSVASTVVLLRALEQLGLLSSINGQIAVGWLVVEDLVMVLVLVLLPPLAASFGTSGSGTSGDTGSLLITLGTTLGKIGLFVAFMLIAGKKIFPWLLWQVASSGSRELFTLCVVAAALGIAFGAAELFGVSFALGAFFAGMVMRESPLSHRAAEESLPLREAFSVLFFVSVGMLFDPSILLSEPLQLLAVVSIVVFGKSLVAFAIVLLFRYPLNTALTVSVSLAQIGEFSFILATLGLSLNVLPHDAQSLILAAAIFSIALNPLLFKMIEPLQNWIRQRSKMAREYEHSHDPLAELPSSVPSESVTGHVVIVGYGRVGRRIARELREQGITFVIAEQNRERVEQLRAQGLHAVAGDGSAPSVLIQAHVVRASIVVIAIPDVPRARRMIEITRMLNPRAELVVRAHSEEEASLLEQISEGTVFLGEHELAGSMVRHVRERWQAKPASSDGGH